MHGDRCCRRSTEVGTVTTPEQATWTALRRAVGDRWHATRHENRLRAGTPDVSFGADGAQGWIELKRLSVLPRRDATGVRVRSFTAEQRLFLRERGRAGGGHCFLLLHVGRGPRATWLLFDDRSPVVATDGLVAGRWRFGDLVPLARRTWVGTPDPNEFIEEITR